MHRYIVLSLTSVHSVDITIEISEFDAINDLVTSWMEHGESINIIDIVGKHSHELGVTLLELTQRMNFSEELTFV